MSQNDGGPRRRANDATQNAHYRREKDTLPPSPWQQGTGKRLDRVRGEGSQ